MKATRRNPNSRKGWSKGLFVLTAVLLTQAVNATSQPNIVIILADDMGWNDVSYHGSEINTPHIDALAAAGIELNRFYAQPSCSPTRAALMTGRSPVRLGVLSPFSKNNPTGLPLGERLLPQYVKQAGYQTFLTGKWHLGYQQSAYHPNQRGFDHFYGHVTGGIGYWNHVHAGGLDWQRNGTTVREEGYSTHLIADEAVRLIRTRDRDRPLFLYASFNAPHLPNEAPAETVARYAHIDNPYRRLHAAMVEELDGAIGRLITALEEEGMLENTLIWFMSDNGGLNASSVSPALVKWSTRLENWFGSPLPFRILEFLRTNALEGGSDNAPLRMGKQSIYEGGTRVPSIIYWKDRLEQARFENMVTVQDVAPTVLSAAGISDGSTQFDGMSHWASVLGGEHPPVPEYLITGRDGEAIFRFPWKLIALNSGEFELYNVTDDPLEQVDRAADKPALVDSLKASLESAPRGESVNLPLIQVVFDPDFFGGEEDRPPYAGPAVD